jgi:flagellar protein FlaG
MVTQISPTLPANAAQSLSIGSKPVSSQPSAAGGNIPAAQESVAPQPNRPLVDIAAEPNRQPVDIAVLSEAVDAINHKLQQSNQQLRFTVDHDSGKVLVRVVDSATDETIRQIPSEVAIAISHSLEKLQGLLVRQEA